MKFATNDLCIENVTHVKIVDKNGEHILDLKDTSCDIDRSVSDSYKTIPFQYKTIDSFRMTLGG